MTCDALDHFVAIMMVALTGGFFTIAYLAVRKVAHIMVDEIHDEFNKKFNDLTKDEAKHLAVHLLKEARKSSRRKR